MALVTSQGYQLTPDVSPLVQQLTQALGQRREARQQEDIIARKEKIAQDEIETEKLRQDFKATGDQMLRVHGLADFTAKRKELAVLGQEAIKRGDDPTLYTDALNITNPDELNLFLTRVATAAGNADKVISQGIAQQKAQAKADEPEPIKYKDIETVGGKKFGVNEATGTYEAIPMGQQATIALQERETAKQEADEAAQIHKEQQTVFTQTQSLRKEFESKTKPQQQAMDAFRSFQSLQEADKELIDNFKSNFGVFAAPGVDKKKILDDSQAISDIALIFSFFKTVDPASTVREGEFATIENAGGIDTRFRNMYTRLLEGGRLNKAQRSQIVRIAQNKAKTAQKEIDRQSKRFKFSAKKLNIDPDLVIIPELSSTGKKEERLFNTGNKTAEGRPIYKNQSGDFVTERTITENIPELGGFVNIPTVFEGRFLSPNAAISKVIQSGGSDPITGRKLQVFTDVNSAVSAAKSRSKDLGATMNQSDQAELEALRRELGL